MIGEDTQIGQDTQVARAPSRKPLTETLDPPNQPPQAEAADPAEGDSAEDRRDVESAAKGDRAAFERLVVRHQQAVINAASYFMGDYQDALEVAQETFLKAFRGLASFRSQSKFRTWLLRIAVNTSRSTQSKRRAKKRAAVRTVSIHMDRPGDDEESTLSVAGIEGPPDELLQRKEVKEALEEAILNLDPDSREVVVMRDLSGESYESISRTLDVPIGTVKSKVHRARLQLRESLKAFL